METLTVYRGFDGRFGALNPKNGTWVTPQDYYAKIYTLDPRCQQPSIAELKLNTSRLKFVSSYELDNYDIDGDELEFSENDIDVLYDAGYTAFKIEINSYDAEAICLFSNDAIVSARILSKEEYDAIQIPEEYLDDSIANSVKEALGEDTYGDRYALAAKLINQGYLIHGTPEEFDQFDSSKIKGGFRAKEGYGFYFSDMPYKSIDYGTNLKLVKKDDFRFLDAKAEITKGSPLYQELFGKIDELEDEKNKLEYQLGQTRNVREYDAISAEIEKISGQLEGLDDQVKMVVDYTLEHEDVTTVGGIEYNIPQGWIPRLCQYYVACGYDGYVLDGIYTIFNFTKLNEKMISYKNVADESVQYINSVVSEALEPDDRKDVLYIGIRLSEPSKATLANIGEWFVKEKLGWTKYKMFCDHMTIAFKTAITDDVWEWFKDFEGIEQEMTVFQIGYSDKACAVEVLTNIPSQNQHKHITIATNLDNGGKPVDSNRITEWVSMNEFVLHGTISRWTK